MYLRATLVWLLILVLAILNGAFRDLFMSPRLGAQVGHVLSTLILSALVFLLTSLTLSWIGPDTAKAAWAAGVYWLVLTLCFEFGAGHWLFGKTWDQLSGDYDVLHGRVWPLVLLATLIAPRLIFYLRLR